MTQQDLPKKQLPFIRAPPTKEQTGVDRQTPDSIAPEEQGDKMVGFNHCLDSGSTSK